jgi:hypothetical protein
MNVVTVNSHAVLPKEFSVFDVSRRGARLKTFFTTRGTLSAPQSVPHVVAAVE